MPPVTTSAVILRSIEYGDFDLIVTFFTQAQGKRAALAKNARKSFKRFGGALELFSKVSIVYAHGKKKGRAASAIGIQPGAAFQQYLDGYP